MKAYFNIIRPKNLLIIGLSQLFIYVFYLLPHVGKSGIQLQEELWWMFIIDTMILAASGYIVNDIIDVAADGINKPLKSYIGKGGISRNAAWYYYGALLLVGFLVAWFISLTIGRPGLLWIYPFAAFLLFIYSWYFKKRPIVGNLIVSIFCAFVPGIIWYAEWGSFEEITQSNASLSYIKPLFIAYISFAFLSTFLREIIKDLEDLEGDRESGYRTLPLWVGETVANRIALVFGILLTCSYGFWLVGFMPDQKSEVVVAVIVALVVPTLVINFEIFKAKERKDYSRISKRLKYLMIISLFVFLCIPFLVSS